MPIGASKLGVLGAGLVPGGSVTFNAPGTWPIPPGVKKVSITGRGGTGNPGNPGNAGNAGDIGSGGGGGAGGATQGGPGTFPGKVCTTVFQGGRAWSGRCGNFLNNFAAGGTTPSPPSLAAAALSGNPGSTGSTGSAGQAGNAGNAGTAGNASTALGNNFPGGAAGNAGVAGAAGNGGSGGNGGGGGNGAPVGTNNSGNGGTGGNGGGSGTPGVTFAPAKAPPNPGQQIRVGGAGGGGAGATNDGTSASPNRASSPSPGQMAATAGRGGTTSNYSFGLAQCGCNAYNQFSTGTAVGSNTTGGQGALGPRVAYPPHVNSTGNQRAPMSITNTPGAQAGYRFRDTVNQGNGMVTPYPINTGGYQAIRSGGGGSGGARSSGNPPDNSPNSGFNGAISGGGGGGGRGNVGNAGGAGGAGGTGAAGTPQTFNCVPVTPGGTAPITVASPGGQIVISWNPQ